MVWDIYVSWGSSVSIVSDYTLDDRGSIIGRDKGLASVSRPDLDPHSLLYSGYQGSISGSNARPGSDADHSPPSSAEVKN
jgi:hypothetical protein